jgi:hypothetical protein
MKKSQRVDVAETAESSKVIRTKQRDIDSNLGTTKTRNEYLVRAIQQIALVPFPQALKS